MSAILCPAILCSAIWLPPSLDQSPACPLQVIEGIKNSAYANLYNPENMFIGKDGAGAGNIWAKGYSAVSDGGAW